MDSVTSEDPVLDVRPGAVFVRRHRTGAVNVPLECLADRVHELPPPHVPITVYDDNLTRARWACSRLRQRGRGEVKAVSGLPWLESGPISCGPSSARLWQPHGFLVESLKLIENQLGGFQQRVALDLACGSGRDSVYMALAGLRVHAWDHLAEALDRCAGTAARSGVVVLTDCRDLEAECYLPDSAFDVVTCFNYLHRPLFPAIRRAIRPGGFVIYETFLVEQRDRFGKPKRDAFLLHPGELQRQFEGFEILVAREGLASPRRCVASLVARRPHDQ